MRRFITILIAGFLFLFSQNASSQKLKDKLEKAGSDAEKEKIIQAARWGLAALDNREEVVRHED